MYHLCKGNYSSSLILLLCSDHNSIVWLTRFKNIQGQLARWLEELSQYDFRVIHRRGTEHINADRLSRIEDPLESCNCYTAGDDVRNLPCGGCTYCVRAHNQWGRFNEDVDDVVPLAIRSIKLLIDKSLPSEIHEKISPSEIHEKISPSEIHEKISPSEIHEKISPSEIHERISPSEIHKEISPSAFHIEVQSKLYENPSEITSKLPSESKISPSSEFPSHLRKTTNFPSAIHTKNLPSEFPVHLKDDISEIPSEFPVHLENTISETPSGFPIHLEHTTSEMPSGFPSHLKDVENIPSEFPSAFHAGNCPSECPSTIQMENLTSDCSSKSKGKNLPAEFPENSLPSEFHFVGRTPARDRISQLSNWADGLSPIQLREAQLNDPDLTLIIKWLENSYFPSDSELRLTSPSVRSLWLNREQLVFKNEILYYSWSNRDDRGDCLIIPDSLKSKVLYQCHDAKESGHLGQSKTLDRLKAKFYWYNMSKDSKLYVEQCSICNRNKKLSVTPRHPHQNFHAGFPMERVHVDIIGPFNRSKKNNAYILVMVDQFTKWVEQAALPAQSAELTARAVLNHFVKTFGCPLEIHSDQGGSFQGELFQSFCKLLEIAKTRTTQYHPSGNGQCEVFNKVILQMIRSYLSKGYKEWDEYQPSITMALHSMKNRSTGYSANMLMLGRETIQPIDLMLGNSNESPKYPSEWVSTLASDLSRAHRSARKAIGQSQFRQKRDYDLKVLKKAYNVGDVVYLRDTSAKVGVSRKLRPPFIGPYLIIKARAPLYVLQGRKRCKTIHHDRLKPCGDSSFPMWLQRKRHALLNQETSIYDEDPEEDFPLPFQFMEDAPFESLFDPDATLPYMLGDSEPNNAELSLNQGFDTENIPNTGTPDSGDLPDTEYNALIPTKDISGQKQSRSGRNINPPARYRD